MSDWPALISEDLVDITDRFLSACRISLLPGELCHGKWFTLQYVISAIEIMDPKMDAMMLCNHRYITVSDVLKSNSLPLGPFTEITTLLGIMDHLLASLVTWLTGDSLAQSVFTCMYMHCTQLIKDKYLRLFCEIVRRIVSELRSVIIQMGAFDEEDHYGPTHGMPINEPFIFDQMPEPGSEALHKLTSDRLVDCAKLLSEEITTDNNFSKAEPTLMQNLRLRMEFVAFLLEFTQFLFTSLPPSQKDPSSEEFEGYSLSYESNVIANTCTGRSEANNVEVKPSNLWEKLYESCLILEPILNKLMLVSQKLESSVPTDSTSSSVSDVIGFEPTLNQSSLPSCMPRLIFIHGHKASFLYFIGLFTHLNKILCCFKEFSSWHQNYPSPLYLNVLWAAIQNFGQKPSIHVKKLLSTGNSSDVCNTALCSCIVSRTFTHFLYFTLMQHKSMSTLGTQSHSPTHYECFSNSWMQLEPTKFHKTIKEIIEHHPELEIFFEDLSNFLARIPALYCLNRSRQRAVLVAWLAKLPELLLRCNQAQNMIGVGLAYSVDHKTESSTKNIIEYINNYAQIDKFATGPTNSMEHQEQQLSIVPLNLVCYVCYIYYHLAWDYLISGFQLELHAPHEWVFIYTFMIKLFSNLGELVKRISCDYLSLRCDAVDSGPITDLPKDTQPKSNCCSENHNHVQNPKSVNRRRNRKKNRANNAQNEASTTEDKSISKHPPTIDSFFPGLHEIGSSCEIYTINVHQCLNSGTLYALRALQRDSGGEPILDFDLPNYIGDPQNSDSFSLNSFFESYARRLGIFLIHPNSPLSDPAGVMSSYDSWRTFLAHELVKDRSTSVLYSEASTAFDHALNMVEAVKKARQFGEKSTHNSIGPQYKCFSQILGPPDDISQLEKLAKWNSIACRVLSTCEDRRPQFVGLKDGMTANSKIGPQKCAFLSKSSPVQLDFNFLESRTYPLIRLISSSSPET